MCFMTDNHVQAIYKYVGKVYGKKYFTQEVIVRAFKNLTLEERNAFYAELVELKTCGMHNAFFGTGGKHFTRVRCLVFGKLVVTFVREKGNLNISSIVPAPKATVITSHMARNFVVL